jgi:hypothetical protein
MKALWRTGSVAASARAGFVLFCLTLAGCYHEAAESPAPPTPPLVLDGPQSQPASADLTLSPLVIPVPEVPQIEQPIEGGPITRAPFAYHPGPAAHGLPTNPGPITGFGPGGLAQPPGAPSNPPFH